MKYVMKQKLFSWGDDFTIKNDNNQDTFFVDGKVFSIGKQLSFQDLQGNELAFIKQKIFAWGPTYEIHRNGSLFAVIKKEVFTLFSCKFTIDLPGPNDLEAKGDFFDHEYSFKQGKTIVATVSKQWFTLTDTYGVEIITGGDDILILACTVAIDMACDGEKK